MKKYLVSVMCILMLLACTILTSCGDDAGDDPNLGLYIAKTGAMSGIEIGVEDVFDGGFSIELKGKGKGTAKVGDESSKIKWTLEGDDFHAEGGGVEFDGTLKDGVMTLEDVMGAGITLKLECEEVMAAAGSSGKKSSDEGTSKADKLKSKGSGKSSDSDSEGSFDALFDGEGEEIGRWELSTVTENGNVYMKEDIAAKGIDSWIDVYAGGTGQIYLNGKTQDMEWENGKMVVPDNGEGGSDEFRYSMASGFLVLVDGDTVLAFERVSESSAATDDSDEGGSDSVISEDLMARYEGDWHGIIMFSDAKGDTFAKRDPSKCDIAARFALDEYGNVTAYVAEAKDDDVEYNFKDLFATLNPDDDCMLLSAKLLGGETEMIHVEESDGLLHMKFGIYAENGDSIQAEAAMRHLDVPWKDSDYPMYPKAGYDFYKGWSLEKILKDFGTMPDGLPEQTHITAWE